MKLVIDIPDEEYMLLQSHVSIGSGVNANTGECLRNYILEGEPYEETLSGDLISREALKEVIKANHYLLSAKNNSVDYGMFTTGIIQAIDNAPTVEVPENAVNCVLTMFGKCSYNKTGCSDCEIKDKIRKALSERPQGEITDEDIQNAIKQGYKDGYEMAKAKFERPQGEWLPQTDFKTGTVWKCSECGGRNHYLRTKFCPHCGADMRGETE